MRSVSGAGRIAAVGAVVIAVVVVAYLLLGQGYAVQISGNQIGKVSDIELAPNSHVYVKMSLKGPHTPLKVGTKAQIKQLSLSSIAGRYIELEPPTESAVVRSTATTT